MMTVRELMEALSSLPPDMLVVQSSDEEGNSYAAVGNLSLGAFRDGEFGLSELTPELRKQGYFEEDLIDGPQAVCLYPGD